MLLKMVQTFSHKKSEQDYQQYLKHVGYMCLLLGILGLFLSFSAKLTSFGSGFLAGLTMALFGMGIYFLIVIRQPSRLHRMYIAAYDERNRQILLASAVATLVFLSLLFVVLISCFAFAGLALAYPTVLIVLLYSLLISFAIFRLIFSKLL